MTADSSTASKAPATAPGDLEAEIRELAARARKASEAMGELSTERKNAWLQRVAERLEASRDRIMAANARDVDAAAEKGVPEPMRNRLGISDGKWADMIQGLRDVIALPDPVGRITNHSVRPNGLRVGQMSIPLGVIAMIYEVAAQRHGRRSGALLEGRQRRDPARGLRGLPLESGARRRAARGGPTTSVFPRTRSRSCRPRIGPRSTSCSSSPIRSIS